MKNIPVLGGTFEPQVDWEWLEPAITQANIIAFNINNYGRDHHLPKIRHLIRVILGR